jgi:hypothetical protein
MIHLPKQGMRNPQIRFYRRKLRQGLEKSFPGCKRMLEIKSEVDHFEEMLEPINQELPEDIKASLEPI